MSYIKKEMIARINVILSKCHITNNGLPVDDNVTRGGPDHQHHHLAHHHQNHHHNHHSHYNEHQQHQHHHHHHNHHHQQQQQQQLKHHQNENNYNNGNHTQQIKNGFKNGGLKSGLKNGHKNGGCLDHVVAANFGCATLNGIMTDGFDELNDCDFDQQVNGLTMTLTSCNLSNSTTTTTTNASTPTPTNVQTMKKNNCAQMNDSCQNCVSCLDNSCNNSDVIDNVPWNTNDMRQTRKPSLSNGHHYCKNCKNSTCICNNRCYAVTNGTSNFSNLNILTNNNNKRDSHVSSSPPSPPPPPPVSNLSSCKHTLNGLTDLQKHHKGQVQGQLKAQTNNGGVINKNNIDNNNGHDNNNIDLGSSERLHVIPHDFEFLKVIGKGSFGKVYLARHKLEAKIYAIKVLSKHMILKHNEERHVMSERNVLIRNLRHPFLIGLHYSFQSKDKLYFVLDYANGGEMFYHLQRDRVFEESRARFYAAEITSALGYLHSEGIVYRDLKPENILLDSRGHLVLTDFGLCKEGIKDLDTTTTFCGTPEYLAPEVLRKEAYDRCVDWWCLGAVLYEMLFGLPPFFSQDRTEMYDNILHQPLKFRNNASCQARHILTGLLSKNKHTRLGFLGGADEVKQHEFFRQINWHDLEAKKICPPYDPEVHDQMDVRNIDPVFIAEPVPSSVCKQHSLGLTNSFPEDSFQGFSYAPSLINK